MWTKIESSKNPNFINISKIYGAARSTLFIIAVLWFVQTFIIGFLPILSIIECSLLPTTISIIICISILKNDIHPVIRSFLSIPLFKLLNKGIRVVYLFHVFIYWFIFKFWPINHLSMMHLWATLIIVYSISLFVHKLIEKPINDLMKRFTKF